MMDLYVADMSCIGSVSLCNCGLIGGTAQLRDLLVPGICNGLGAAFAGLYPGGLHL